MGGDGDGMGIGGGGVGVWVGCENGAVRNIYLGGTGITRGVEKV